MPRASRLLTFLRPCLVLSDYPPSTYTAAGLRALPLPRTGPSCTSIGHCKVLFRKSRAQSRYIAATLLNQPASFRAPTDGASTKPAMRNLSQHLRGLRGSISSYKVCQFHAALGAPCPILPEATQAKACCICPLGPGYIIGTPPIWCIACACAGIICGGMA